MNTEGQCPACGNWHRLKKDGNLPFHFRKTSKSLAKCNGSHNQPLITREAPVLAKVK